MGEAAFSYKCEAIGPGLVELHYRGFMGEHDKAHLAEIAVQFERATLPLGLYYEVPELTGFHRGQLLAHGELFLKHRAKLLAIAVRGAKPAVRFGSITAGLIGRVKLSHFDSRDQAIAWLQSLRKDKTS